VRSIRPAKLVSSEDARYDESPATSAKPSTDLCKLRRSPRLLPLDSASRRPSPAAFSRVHAIARDRMLRRALARPNDGSSAGRLNIPERAFYRYRLNPGWNSSAACDKPRLFAFALPPRCFPIFFCALRCLVSDAGSRVAIVTRVSPFRPREIHRSGST